MNKRLAWIVATVVAVAGVVFGAAQFSAAQQQTAPSGPPPQAEPDDDTPTFTIKRSRFHAPSVATEDGTTKLSLPIDMSTPGWTLSVDSVSEPDAHGRIEVKATAVRPAGMVAQVITRETLSVTLGELDAGEYVVIVRYRQLSSADADADTPYGVAAAIALASE